MKIIIQLIIILGITYSCSSQKYRSNITDEDKGKIEMQIPIHVSSFSPGTYALNIKITEIIENDNRYQVKGIINKTLGSGAGITHLYSLGEIISFELNTDCEFLVNTDYSILFKEMQMMGNNKPISLFIKVLK